MADSTAQTYREAALENLVRAQDGFAAEKYFLAHYLAGLAVECHLRAWQRRKSSEFDARHDLRVLAAQSGFYDLLPQKQLDRFVAAFGTLNLRWRSNHRYYSERQFLNYMNEAQAEQNTKGFRLKNLCRTVLSLALDVINTGKVRWEQNATASTTNTAKMAGRRPRRVR